MIQGDHGPRWAAEPEMMMMMMMMMAMMMMIIIHKMGEEKFSHGYLI
jgi:hypothetical protein